MCAAIKGTPTSTTAERTNSGATTPTNSQTKQTKGKQSLPAQINKTQPKPETQLIKVTAKALADEYSENAVAAEKKYENKRILVTGTITDIGKDVLDTAFVVLKGGGEAGIHHVQCMFKSDQEDILANLKKGQTVTIEGESDGLALGINVILKYSQVKP